ncbi:DUF1206 domain-containing protein [Litoreibacter roseus]|uniref:DUF1206 domain-containing protein n=1 Tax=Litoreibacter roseus TaxID=2601869 RepID=A0A6N6JN56_9RHOB|nr:DUF1206 domain-containing protein [Litoreibacter roseus]GFE66798.1 hypothetical protein KIN_38720 [Litoreibacter roseus]
MANDGLNWTIPCMRAGYAGRGIAYVAVAGFSLYALWRGRQAEGPGEVFDALGRSFWGDAVLMLIALGMTAYFVWRVVCAVYDLEDYGTDIKGLIARGGQITTGTIHLGLGAVAAIAAFTVDEKGDGGGSIEKIASQVIAMPMGWVILGAAGIVTVIAGGYYLKKAITRDYQKTLRSCEITRNWNLVLEAGIAAQGFVVLMIGAFLARAAYSANAGDAGGMGDVFDMLATQVYGQLMVTACCLGLLAFAVFCFVNSGYRIIPKLNHGDMDTLRSWAKDKAKEATA